MTIFNMMMIYGQTMQCLPVYHVCRSAADMFSHSRYLILRSYFGHPLYNPVLTSSQLNFVNLSLKTKAYSAHTQKCTIINFNLPNFDMHLNLQSLLNIICAYACHLEKNFKGH